MNPTFLLKQARKLNNSLNDDYTCQHVMNLAIQLYDEEPHHWHSVSGSCFLGDTTFELLMPVLSLLSSIWVSDIYLRKARDRRSPTMIKRYLQWKDLLLRSLSYTEYINLSTRDMNAEKAFEKEYKKPNRIRCALNVLLSGH